MNTETWPIAIIDGVMQMMDDLSRQLKRIENQNMDSALDTQIRMARRQFAETMDMISALDDAIYDAAVNHMRSEREVVA